MKTNNKAFGMFELTIVILVIAIVLLGTLGLKDIKKNNGKIVVIDQCQYIQVWNGHGYNITHKGNCTNEVHLKK